LALEVIDELDDAAGEFLVGNLGGSGGEASEELDSLSVSLNVLHLVDLGGTSGELVSDLSHDLGGEVDGVSLTGLQE